MKVLMQIRRDAFKKGGGDLIQLIKTKEALEKLGVTVDVSNSLVSNLNEYDIVHLFNLSVIEDTYKQALNAYRQKKPILLSSIFWDKDEYLLNNPNFKVKTILSIFGEEITKFLMKRRKYFAPAWHKQKFVLGVTDLVLTTSKKEAELIVEKFFVKNIKSIALPLGVDVNTFKRADSQRFINKYGIKNFILCVGRIEDLKNQIRIIKAIKGRFPIVFVGSKNYFFKNYVENFEKEIKHYNNILYIEKMPQKELADAYSAAKICVGASWFETFHLASLEALSVGTPVVTTINSPLDEYFSENIFYCNPGDINSINLAIEKAEKIGKNKKIANNVLEKYNWNNIAQEIEQIYLDILGNY